MKYCLTNLPDGTWINFQASRFRKSILLVGKKKERVKEGTAGCGVRVGVFLLRVARQHGFRLSRLLLPTTSGL